MEKDIKPSLSRQDGNLKIGAVARLTGVSAHTLRKWESRYDSVVPGRTERGQRVYSHADVERLLLIKRLVNAGVAPRDVASLSLEELTEQSEHLTHAQTSAGAEITLPVRVALLGSDLAAMFALNQSPASGLEIVASARSEAELESSLGDEPVDLLVYECATVQSSTRTTLAELMTRVGAGAVIVLYRFSARADLLTLQSPQIATLRAPADRDTLERVGLELVRPRAGMRRDQFRAATPQAEMLDDVPAPRLSHEVIAKIARSSPRVRCECPHHLADIILGLRAFEEYSEACENRNPEDAALHRYLWRSAAQARVLFEDAIERVAAVEGISLVD